MPDSPANTTSDSSSPSALPPTPPSSSSPAEAVAAYTHATSHPPAYTHSHPEPSDEEAPLLSQPSQPTPAASRSAPPNTTSHPRNRNVMDGLDNLFRFSLPQLPSSQAIRTAGVYISGALFSLGFWFFIDASVYSRVNNPGDVHIKFVDWIPGICSTSGMLVINSIEKSHLSADSFSYSGSSGSSVGWKARLVLFLGFALMAGGLAGSVAVLVLKYIVEQYEFETMYLGIANVVANSLIMLSSVVLWVSQNMEEEYSYHLTL